jgi:hypothetical protein
MERSVENISRTGRQHRDLSATLRSGRDDKGEGGAFIGSGCQIKSAHHPWKRYAPVEMTKERVALSWEAAAG